MRHAPLSVLAIVAIVGVATLMLSVSLAPEPVMLAVSLQGPVYDPYGANTIIAHLEVGEFLGNEVTSLTEVHLNGLRSGVVHGRDISTDYIQTIRFTEPGEFNGCSITFGRDELNRVGDFLQCKDAVDRFQR